MHKPTLPKRGPTSRTFFSQRLRLHYVDWGNEGAPPLLLVHGGQDHCRNWDWVAEDLRHDYHVICPDLRGQGDSAWPAAGSNTMAGYVADLAQLIHQQKLAPVTIIAHSLGGNISLRYTGIYPENVNKLVCHRRAGAVAGGARRTGGGGHAAAGSQVDRGQAWRGAAAGAALSDD